MAIAAAIAGWLLVLAAPAAAGGLQDFAVETSHSLVEFRIAFLHTSVHGRFDGYRGTILYDQARPENSSVTVVIETKSLDTGSDHRDEHLRSDDFFDVEKYPTIKFQSREVKRQGESLLLVGPLSMHGVTRDVRIPFRMVAPPSSDGHGLSTVNFEGGVRLARKDFDILGGSKHNDWFDTARSATMADTVEIILDIQGWTTDFAGTADSRTEQSVARVNAVGADSLIRALRSRAATDPKSIEGQEYGIDQLGRALVARNRVEEGIKILRLDAELFPNSARTHTNLARALETSGRRAEAIAAYDRALHLDPNYPLALEFMRRLSPPTK